MVLQAAGVDRGADPVRAALQCGLSLLKPHFFLNSEITTMTASAPVDLDNLLDTVHDEATFINFMQALAGDFAADREAEAENPSGPYGAGHLGWENGTVDDFLFAAVAWGHIKMLTGQSAAEKNPWRRCAHILYAGKFYE
jgi:hypothetical protein